MELVARAGLVALAPRPLGAVLSCMFSIQPIPAARVSTDHGSPPASSDGSPASTPPASPRTEAPPLPPVVHFPPELLQNMDRQAEVLGQLMANQQTLREELQARTLAA